MVNVLLTDKCVRRCPYCFASGEMARSAASDFMAWEDVVYLGDFLERSGHRRVSLIGGEPTLHPEFVDIVLYFLERRFEVTAFTSGILSAEKLEDLARSLVGRPTGRLTFVCNLNDPAQTPEPRRETEAIERFLAVAAPWTMLGFNIYRTDFSLDHLFDLYRRHPLKRTLRLGLAHPIAGGGNQFLGIDRIGDAVARLWSMRGGFEDLQLSPGLDCGFPLCAFSDEQLGWLVRLGGKPSFTCHPAIDVAPDMEVYACFPLATRERRSLYEFDTLAELTGHFDRLHASIRAERAGIYDACAGCRHRQKGVCAGGAGCQTVLAAARDRSAHAAEAPA